MNQETTAAPSTTHNKVDVWEIPESEQSTLQDTTTTEGDSEIDTSSEEEKA